MLSHEVVDTSEHLALTHTLRDMHMHQIKLNPICVHLGPSLSLCFYLLLLHSSSGFARLSQTSIIRTGLKANISLHNLHSTYARIVAHLCPLHTHSFHQWLCSLLKVLLYKGLTPIMILNNLLATVTSVPKDSSRAEPQNCVRIK